MKALIAALCAVAVVLAPWAVAQEKSHRKAARQAKPKVEKLACRLGTEDQHARIAVELHNGKVNNFAYYSKWKPRTCSMAAPSARAIVRAVSIKSSKGFRGKPQNSQLISSVGNST